MKLFYGVVLSFVLMGCITTYRDFPMDALDQKPKPGMCGVMYYNVKRFDVLDMGGYSELQNVFRDTGVCKKTEPVDANPGKGFYVEIDTNWKPLTLPALIFGYISVATLTILPAWSTRDGYVVKYNVYIDGNKVETYTYEITRKVGIWIGLIPFTWINLITYDEGDAFEATAYQFVSDARQYLTSPGL